MFGDINVWHLIIIIVVAAAQLVLVIAALVSIIKHPDASTTAKVIWVLIVIVFPILGPLVWFVSGRSALSKRAGG
jgi:hypothetical protein